MYKIIRISTYLRYKILSPNFFCKVISLNPFNIIFLFILNYIKNIVCGYRLVLKSTFY